MRIPKTGIRVVINALRSGEYQQTRRMLQNENGHCCLGVGCEVLIPPEKQIRNDRGFLVGDIPMYQDGSPNWFKLLNHDFHIRTGEYLTVLNDCGKLCEGELDPFTFDEIADLLQLIYLEGALD